MIMGILLTYGNLSDLTSIDKIMDESTKPKPEISTEALTTQTNDIPETVASQVPQCDGRKQQRVFYTRIYNKTTNATDWMFILSPMSGGSSAAFSDFVLLMDRVAAEDTVMIYGPSTCSANTASFIASAIVICKSKNISICIPYVFNLGAAYILSYANRIVFSPYGILICKQDDITVGGGTFDTKASLEMHANRNYSMVNRLVVKGLLTEAEADHVLNAQGQVVCYCKHLADRYSAFNDANKKA